VYSYFVYPLVLAAFRATGLVPRRRPPGPPPRDGGPLPKVTLIIAAYNEEERLKAKLDNSLALDYPADRLEILVASDASTDGTDAIALAEPRVALARTAERKGKEHAQRNAIAMSKGDILVFTDAATRLPPESIRRIVRNFADPGVGAVSSEDRLLGETDGSGEGLYVRYEMLLRRLETEVNSLVGLSGSFFAARREACEGWSDDLPSDFNTVLRCRKLGWRAVADEGVIGYYPGIRAGQSEFRRKVRTLVRGMAAFFANTELLDIRRYGFFSFQLASHKLMRWLAPVFMALLLLASAASAFQGHPAGIALLAGQALFYGLAALGGVLPSFRSLAPVKVAFFFSQVNLAILAAWGKFLRGERITAWTPSRR
jgi:cellulose synthase/poly-beta-1,6-N-acetylglucosamine synthase-like glycosyltransferase